MATTQAFCAARTLEAPIAARLAIIVEELVTNLVEHGGVEEDDEIELTLEGGDGAIRIGLGDSGRAFDPRDSAPTGEIPDRGGGAGLDLVRAWAEILDYRSRDGWNRLDLRMPARA